MVTVKEALAQVLATVKPLPLEKVGLLDTLGRVLGEGVRSGRDIPPKNNSAMDGYALRAVDTKDASKEIPATFRVVEDVPAGYLWTKKIGAGEAARIMTGAPIPEGADAVVKVEDTESDGDIVRVFVPAAEGLNIRFAGGDVRVGELVIRKGSVIRPAEAGMLAALGRSVVYVHQVPVVAIVSTGDELADIDEPLSPTKISNSNGYALAAQVLECGAVPLLVGIARDDRRDLAEKFRMALRADVILSSGGVSVGDYDLVKEVMMELGTRIKFWRIAMRPGRPLAFGTLKGKPLFGLPGNPVSSMVSFEQFVRPALRKMMGHRDLYRRTVRAALTESITKEKGLRYFVRGRVVCENGLYTVATTGGQGSGILKSMVKANGLIVLPEDLTEAKKGDTVTVQLFERSLENTPSPEHL
jgi:molybdopterin molybdotransferase